MSLMRREFPDIQDMFRRWFDVEPSERRWLRTEEFVEGDTMVIRAEIPGIDPEKDVDISIADGMLRISAEKQEKSEDKTKDYYRSEFRYGSFARSMALPATASEDDVEASYKDGVLEVRVKLGEAPAVTPKKIPITKA